MKKLSIPSKKIEFQYKDDVNYIVKVAEQNGILITKYAAHYAWRKWSEDFAAGWLSIDRESDQEHIIYVLNEYLVDVED
jgi:hypothetical protein